VDEDANLKVEERGDVPPISPRAEEREGKKMNPGLLILAAAFIVLRTIRRQNQGNIIYA
jgi:hypothetical protein